MVKTKPEKLTVKRILKAIENTGGLKTKIADKLGVHRHTIDRYENKYPTVKQALIDETNKILDKAESVIFRSINEGDRDDSKWFLARKGKQRGYSEKIDMEQKGELKTIIEVRYEDEVKKTEEKEDGRD